MTNRKSKSTIKTAFILLFGAVGMGWLYLTGAQINGAETRDALIAAIWSHVGHGVILAPFLLAYALWRASNKPFHFSAPTSLTHLNKLIGWLLIASVAFLVLSGPFVVWTHGFPLKVFDWFVIQNPISKHQAIHDQLEAAHVSIAKTIPWVLGADILTLAVMTSLRQLRRVTQT
ncbi:MAG: hypothetical protein DHS20C05_09930 [Hyphococcus sp.]|nr:MAG: hypothetical protein DHS20C05_09930 [Marinicaulis sp.]